MNSTSKTTALVSAALLLLLTVLCVVVMEWTQGIDTVSSPRQNLKGSIDSETEIFSDNSNSQMEDFANGNATKGGKPSKAVCLVSAIDVEMDSGKKRKKKSAKEEEDEEILVCSRVSDKFDSGVSDAIMYIRNMASSTVISNQAALKNNEWFIEFAHDWIEQGRHQTTVSINIPDDEEVKTIDPSSVPHHHSVSPANRRHLATSLNKRQRRLQKVTGKRRVSVVSVELTTVTHQVLYDHFFGQNNSLVSQMDECSQGQVQIQPHPVNSIIQVFPRHAVSSYTFVELYDALVPDIKRALGIRQGQSITSVTDHIFLVVPDAINRRPGELGWGATPGFFAGTVESLSVSRSTMTLLHEIGHNFGLGHAYEDYVAYTDMSTVMGYSHRDVVKMCYNGHNMWDMGWFPDRSLDIKLSDHNDARVEFDLAFYGDYAKTSASQPVIARYKDAYFTFNRKRDMNLQTKEYGDMLLIVQEYPGEYHAHTNLEEALSVGDNPYLMKFDNNKDKIFIEVCSYRMGTLQRPDIMTVAVARKQNNACRGGTRSAASVGGNRAITRETPLLPTDCAEARPWVELKNLEYPNGVQVELCAASIARNPDNYCTQIDDSSHAPLWMICRLECPQSGCADTVGQGNGGGGVGNGGENGASCRNLFSWVEVEVFNEYGERNFVSRTCKDMAVGFFTDRQEFCDKKDTLTHLPVRQVCPIECPGTGCGFD